jgi:hypothetical protein
MLKPCRLSASELGQYTIGGAANANVFGILILGRKFEEIIVDLTWKEQ